MLVQASETAMGITWDDFAMIMAFIGIGAPFLWLVLYTIVRGSSRRRQLDLIERTLDREDLPPDQRRELIEVLKLQAHRPPSRFGSKLVFTIGWLGIFGGALLAGLTNDNDMEIGGIALGVMSFALVTLPLALRELDRRRGSVAQHGGRT